MVCWSRGQQQRIVVSIKIAVVTCNYKPQPFDRKAYERLLLLVRYRQGGDLQQPFSVGQRPHKYTNLRVTYMNPFSACLYENRYSATRLFKSPASLTLWTAARAFAVVVGGGVVVGAGVVVVVGSGVVVVVGSGVVVVGSSVVTTRLLASFWPARKWRQKSAVKLRDPIVAGLFD